MCAHIVQITLFVEIENLKRAFRLICCCNRCSSLDEDQGEKTATAPSENSAKKGVGLSSVSVTPHSRMKALSYVLGVDSIDALVSDFEHSVGHIIYIYIYTITARKAFPLVSLRPSKCLLYHDTLRKGWCYSCTCSKTLSQFSTDLSPPNWSSPFAQIIVFS